MIFYIKGKALNCFESYKKEAEELLSAAVKLDPKNYLAWTALGQCLWKKGDRVQASNCFQESLNQCASKEALWELSVLMRQLRIKGQDVSVTVEESIKLAKQAIQLDVNDHKSWYILGNAWCTRFFSTSYNRIDLDKALNCYKRSESLGGTGNPDLYLNGGNVLRYLQQYRSAVVSFRKAYDIDPSLNEANTSIDEIHAFLNRIKDLIANHGKIRKTRLDQLVLDLTTSPHAVGSVPASRLHPGSNDGFTISVKPVLPVSKGTMPPKSFLCVDSEGCFLVLSIYDIGEDASQFVPDDILTVTRPYLRPNQGTETGLAATAVGSSVTDQTSEESLDTMIFVQVFDIRTLKVNGALINRSSLAAPELKIETFDA